VLDANQLEYIKQNYADCLCHSCLLEVKNHFYAIDVNPYLKKVSL
jgi:hypothetical protein